MVLNGLKRNTTSAAQRLLSEAMCPCCEPALVSEAQSWHGEGSGQVCAASPGLRGSVLGLQVSQVSEQQLFSLSKDHSILHRKDLFFFTHNVNIRERSQEVSDLCSERGHKLLVQRPNALALLTLLGG